MFSINLITICMIKFIETFEFDHNVQIFLIPSEDLIAWSLEK
jgi:hypothetical protein